MLAVKPSYRNCNLGQKLKLAQRDRVLAQSIKIMSWTFDPLQSLNAYFNFRKLGVVSDRYLENFYGEDAPSFLHRNGTDRLWVTWPLANPTPARAASSAWDLEPIVPLVQLTADDSPTCSTLSEGLKYEQALIEIPSDINELQQQNSDLAWIWRVATRWAFTKAIEAGYLVVDFQRTSRADKQIGSYVLARGKTLADYI
jgi:predicted GNAT superfamily acetyltransferase